jgi:branched-chain amino acid transport system substrate-binding protein
MEKKRVSRRGFIKLTGAATFGTLISGFPRIIKAQGKEILIGAVHPLSGMVAEAGGMAVSGLELAVDHVNTRGGIKSLKGAKLKLLVEDSESKVETGGIAAEKLIRKGIVCLTGAFQNAVTLNVARIADQNKIVFVNDISTMDELTHQGFKYTFRVFPALSRLMETGMSGVVEIAKQSNKPLKTGVVIHISELTGKIVSDLFIKMTQEKGEPWKILKRISYPENPMSLASEIREAKELKPDALFIVCRLRDAIMLVEEMYKQRFDVNGIFGLVSSGHADPSYLKQGKLSEYTFNICPWHDEIGERARKIAQEYESRFKKPFNMNGSYAYDAIMVIADALERAGSVDKDDLRKALLATKLANKTSIGGPIEFDQYGDNKNAGSGLMQIQGGKSKIVYPPEFATAKVIFPVPSWDKR